MTHHGQEIRFGLAARLRLLLGGDRRQLGALAYRDVLELREERGDFARLAHHGHVVEAQPQTLPVAPADDLAVVATLPAGGTIVQKLTHTHTELLLEECSEITAPYLNIGPPEHIAEVRVAIIDDVLAVAQMRQHDARIGDLGGRRQEPVVRMEPLVAAPLAHQQSDEHGAAQQHADEDPGQVAVPLLELRVTAAVATLL